MNCENATIVELDAVYVGAAVVIKHGASDVAMEETTTAFIVWNSPFHCVAPIEFNNVSERGTTFPTLNVIIPSILIGPDVVVINVIRNEEVAGIQKATFAVDANVTAPATICTPCGYDTVPEYTMDGVVIVVTPVALSTLKVHPVVPPGTQLDEQGAAKSHVVVERPHLEAPYAIDSSVKTINIAPQISKKF